MAPRACEAVASSRDGPYARPAREERWPCHRSSRTPWARPASGPGWQSCWPAGRPAASNTSGGSGCGGPVRIAVRNGGTCVLGVGAWATPKQEQPYSTGRRPAPEENPSEEDPATPRKPMNSGRRPVILTGSKKTQPKKTPSSDRRIYCTSRTALTGVTPVPSVDVDHIPISTRRNGSAPHENRRVW